MPRTRRSIRLQGFDYSQPGEYFVTICTYRMRCLLGEIRNGRTQLNRFGRMVEEEWLRTSSLRPDVKLDEFVIMPNHVHGILVVRDSRGTSTSACDQGVRAHVCAPTARTSIAKRWRENQYRGA